ncbi:MAG: aldo/keto reductase [Nitrospira sp. CG24A]|nr:MAG: aldo/keto reductase [Nitrospira sp. CG24A]
MRPNEDRGDNTAPMIGRREVCKTIGLLGSAVMLGGISGLTRAMADTEKPPSGLEGQGLPRRELGRTGVTVPILGLGGAHLLKTSDEEGTRIVHEAINAGLTFFDNAWDYANNRSEAVMGKALKGHRHEVFLMTKMCTHGRGKKIGMLHLEQSLRRLGTDYLDLWQIHEVSCDDDPERLFQVEGAIEALAQAKQQGKVRFIGFTGHTNPSVHLNVLKYNFPFDTCQLPLNVFDASYKSFERQVLPELLARGIAPIAMKSLCGKGKPITQGILTVEEAMRYVWSLPVATLVSGIDSREVLRQNLAIARRFVPMTQEEMAQLRRRVSSHATEGQFELYKKNPPWSCDQEEVERRFSGLEKA